MKKKLIMYVDDVLFDELNPFLIDQGNDLSKLIDGYVKELYTLKKKEIDLWNKKQIEDFLK